MRITKTLALLAPAALALSACGASEEEVAETDFITEDPAMTAGKTVLPPVPADPRTTLDYAGTYEKLGDDGRKVALTLNADDTYTMMDADDVETTGTYNWYSDNRRILIKEGEETSVYAIGDGAIYKLDSADADIDSSLDDKHMWRKAIRL